MHMPGAKVKEHLAQLAKTSFPFFPVDKEIMCVEYRDKFMSHIHVLVREITNHESKIKESCDTYI